MQKNEVDPYFTPYTKINSKWIKDLKLRTTTIKLLKHKGNFHDTEFSNDFLDITLKAQATTK